MLRKGADAIDALTSSVAGPARAEHALPNLVLLDLNMPNIDGLEILDRLGTLEDPARARVPPIVILSSSEDPEARARARSHSLVRDFLHKPLQDRDASMLADRFGNSVAPSLADRR